MLRTGAVGKKILRTQKGTEPSPKANELNRIGIGELFTEQFGVYPKVTKAFLKILRAGTKGLNYERQVDDNTGGGNVYVFGPEFPKDTYGYERDHCNDGGGPEL
jgi:hypothetical protein